MMSKCGRNISDTLGYRLVCHFFDVICDQSLNRRAATWNLQSIGTLDCKTVVFFANASDGQYSNERGSRLRRFAPSENVRKRLFRSLWEHGYYSGHVRGSPFIPTRLELDQLKVCRMCRFPGAFRFCSCHPRHLAT